MIGKRSSLPVWISVMTSKASSSVPKTAGHDDERRGVLHQHHLADEEVLELDEAIEVGVRLLFARQADVAADAEPAASRAPRLAASMMPGPPPVMTT